MKTLSPITASAAACTHKPRRPAATRLPFPELPNHKDVGNQGFWLAAWMRDLAAKEAIKAHAESPSTQKCEARNPALQLALVAAVWQAKCNTAAALNHVQEAGGLLFAFPESTKFTPGGAIC